MDGGALGGWLGEGGLEFFERAGEVVPFETDEAERGVCAGAERGDGGDPGFGSDAARSFRVLEQHQGARGGCPGAVKLGGAGVGGEVCEVDQERDVVGGDGESGGGGLDGAGRVALFSPGAREEFADGEAECRGREAAFEGRTFFEHGTVEHVEVGVVLGGRFGLQVRKKLRV